jgi:hypothetical protein
LCTLLIINIQEEVPLSKSVAVQVVPKLKCKNAKVQVRVKSTDKGIVSMYDYGV